MNNKSYGELVKKVIVSDRNVFYFFFFFFCSKECSPSRFFFFFQEEDGIRDLYVTGVQTCALPISDRYRQPAIYYYPFFATDGGLISYGPDETDMFRRAAGYVDRILKGDNASGLPVQQ